MDKTRGPDEEGFSTPVSSIVNGDSADVDRQRRIVALGALAKGTDSPSEPATPLFSPTTRRRALRPFGVLLLVALLLATGAAGIYLSQHPQQPPRSVATHTGPLSIVLSAYKVSCPSSSAWSPDGAKLAVLVQQGTPAGCGGQDRAIIALNVKTGQVEGVRPAPYAVDGQDIAWTPDATALAYQAYTPGVTVGAAVPTLILLASGAAPKMIYGPSRPLSPAGYIVWDLQRGTVIIAPEEDLPAALSYRWTAKGEIVPDQPTVLAAPSPNYTGSPASAPTSGVFSRWQPGAIVPISAGVGQAPTTQTYQSVSTLHSPDGRYLATHVALKAKLASSASVSGALSADLCQYPNNAVLCKTPPLEAPDAAFTAIRSAADNGTHIYATSPQTGKVVGGTTQWNPVSVAWRPDGKVVATVLPDQGFDGSNKQVSVSFYRTADARLIGALSAAHTSDGWLQGVSTPVISWSASGDALALLDFAGGRLIVWNGNQMPH